MRKWNKRELENLGFMFSQPHYGCVQIRMPDWPRGETHSRYRLVYHGDKMALALPAKNSYNLGYAWQCEFPAARHGFDKFLKAIYEVQSLRRFREPTLDAITASALLVARRMLLKEARDAR